MAASSLHPFGERERAPPHSYSGRYFVKRVLSSNPATLHMSPWGSEERKEASSPKAWWPADSRAHTIPALAQSLLLKWAMSMEPILRAGRSAFLGRWWWVAPLACDPLMLQSLLWVSLSTALWQSAYLTDLLLPAAAAPLLQPAGHGRAPALCHQQLPLDRHGQLYALTERGQCWGLGHRLLTTVGTCILFFSMLTSYLMLIHFYGNYIDVLGT